MGVHLTFVRSVDLDEWTQSQIDAMRLGGNGNARAYFRKHGVTDMDGPKKYKSKAALTWRTTLAKLVAGEATSVDDLPPPTTTMEQTSTTTTAAAPVMAKPTLAKQLPGASKLVVSNATTTSKLRAPTKNGTSTSTSSSSSKLVMRKPTTKNSFSLTKKSTRVSKLSVVKLTQNKDDDTLEDVETTQNAMMKAKEEQEEKKVEQQLANNESLVQTSLPEKLKYVFFFF